MTRACRGAERRRLMDLGILPGTLIRAEMVSPSGDPTAYRIRGALIALRKEQADRIYITRATEEK
ncbi:MAG: ferrous iron transport protein A [Caldilineae bacterium]|nr:MAG: ferrous iron transport protein A [Caldilineae bacterium]